MTNDAPRTIWAVIYPHHSGKGPPVVNASASATNGQEYIRADIAQAEKDVAVAAEREACAEIVRPSPGYEQTNQMDSHRVIDEILESRFLQIRARSSVSCSNYSNTDEQSALEEVKQEPWRQGYKEGTGEISAAIEEAAAFKLMYSKSRNDALREAAGHVYSFAASCFDDDEDDAGAAVSAAADSILALITADQKENLNA